MRKTKTLWKQLVCFGISLAMTVTLAPIGLVKAEEEADEAYEQEMGFGDLVRKEAREKGVPEAFLRHRTAILFEDGELENPRTSLVEGEEAPPITMRPVATDDYDYGLEIKDINTGVLARTKFDLGEYDFGELKARNFIYCMLVKKNVKGKGYFYFGDSEEPFAEVNIKRCGSGSWEEVQNRTYDVSKCGLNGNGHIYFTYVSEDAVDDAGNIIPETKTKTNLFLEAAFFTEGSTPVLEFDLDNEVNTIERVNGSTYHVSAATGEMNLKVPDDYVCEYTDEKITDTTYKLDYIRGRGNSTWLVDKKPYKIKLDKSTDLFGMGKNKNWVLLANYYDYTLARNKVTYHMASKMNFEFSPKSVCVNVIISGVFCGSYQLCQQIRVGKNNLNIDDLEDKPADTEPDITGGYLLEMGDSWLTADYAAQKINTKEGSFRIKAPEYDVDYPVEAREAQFNYMDNYMKELEGLVYSTDEDFDKAQYEEETGVKIPEEVTWRDYLDEDSMIDFYLIQEAAKNADAYAGSTFLYKKRNGKLYWGPLWDFDFVAWGAYTPDYFSKEDTHQFFLLDKHPWLKTLILNDEAFREKLIKRWEKISEIIKETAAEGGYLDQYTDSIYYSALANYQSQLTYFVYGENYWTKNYLELLDDEGNPYILNYGNEVERFRAVLNDARAFLDEDIDNILEFAKNGIFKPIPFLVDGEVIEEVPVSSDIYGIALQEMPDDPVKDGFVFEGWFYEENGDEYILDPLNPPYETLNGEYDYNKPINVYAKFEPESEVNYPESYDFITDVIYVPLNLQQDETMDGEDYIPSYESKDVDMNHFLNVKPFDAHYFVFDWSMERDPESTDEDEMPQRIGNISRQGIFKITTTGESFIACTCRDTIKYVKVVAFSAEEEIDPEGFEVDSELELKTDEYGNVNFRFDKTEYISCDNYENVSFDTLDEDIVDVNNWGEVYAKKSGVAKVLTILKPAYGPAEVKVTNVKVTEEGQGDQVTPTQSPVAVTPSNTTPTVQTPAPAPAQTSSGLSKATIKKVDKKKKSAKKLKLKVNKVEGAQGYMVSVFKSEDKANAATDSIIDSFSKKAKISINDKNIASKKKLFVRVRAYKITGNQMLFGDWSDVVKVKITK